MMRGEEADGEILFASDEEQCEDDDDDDGEGDGDDDDDDDADPDGNVDDSVTDAGPKSQLPSPDVGHIGVRE